MRMIRLYLILLVICAFVQTDAKQIVFDRKERIQEVPRYRTAQTPFKTNKQDFEMPPRDDLDKLLVSASGQPSEQEIMWIKEQINPDYKLIFVDLRKEKHGYINGEPILWKEGTEDGTLTEIVQEGPLLITDRSGGVYEITPSVAQTEKTLVENLGISYIRFPTRHAEEPSIECLDAFVDFVTNLDKKTWVHLHCREGFSRTTLYFAILDMLHNAHNASCEALLKRHYLIGGGDMANEPELKVQYDFLKRFYVFARLRKKGGIQTWNEYHKQASENAKENYLFALENDNSEKLPSFINKFLSEDFYYLGHGCSTTAFLSADNKTVLKLFKMRDAKTEKEVKKRFTGYQIAMENNKENTGMLFWHLYKTDSPPLHVNIFDRIENQEKATFKPLTPIDLNKRIFAIQLKAKNLGSLIKEAVRIKKPENIKIYLTGVFQLYEKELKRGFLDIDPNFLYNIGFIEDRAIRYDASHLRKVEELSKGDMYTYKKGVLKHFMRWIQRANLEGKTEIMPEIIDWLTHFYI